MPRDRGVVAFIASSRCSSGVRLDRRAARAALARAALARAAAAAETDFLGGGRTDGGTVPRLRDRLDGASPSALSHGGALRRARFKGWRDRGSPGPSARPPRSSRRRELSCGSLALPTFFTL